MKPDQSQLLPPGVSTITLTTHSDRRGDITEIFRNEWLDTPSPVQWLVSRTEANSLRGVHVHAWHWDYYFVVAGELIVALHDLRPLAQKLSSMLRLSGDRSQLVAVPPGVAHGLYAPGDAVFLVGTSEYYNPDDNKGCRWNAPELGFDWPCTDPQLSDRDRVAGSYVELRNSLIADLASMR
jgi:dTDP-4-dehydrorhamnose 3,5-epimerase